MERLREDTVERLARSFCGAQWAHAEPVRVSTEPSYKSLEDLQIDMIRELFTECRARDKDKSDLSPKALAKADLFRLPSFVIIEQSIRTDSASPFLRELLRWYVGTWWAGFRAEAYVLVFLHLMCPRPRADSSWFRALLGRRAFRLSPYIELDILLQQVVPGGEMNLEENAAGAPVKVLPPLAPIQPDDVERWLRRLNVLPSDADPMVQQLYRSVQKQYGPDIRLTYVYDELDKMYRQRLAKESSYRQVQTTR
jgi:hypothetical protein